MGSPAASDERCTWVVVRYVSSRSTGAAAPVYIVGLYSSYPLAEAVFYPMARSRPDLRYGVLACNVDPTGPNALPESE